MSVTYDMMTPTDLLEANKTLLAVRQIMNLQATRFRHGGGRGGEEVRQWATEQVEKLDEEIFLIVMELDNLDLSGDEDGQLARDIAIRESFDVLPFDLPFEVRIVRRVA